MTDTNVNTGGQGTTNWNLSSGAQPKFDPATGKPIVGQPGTGKGMEADATIEAQVQTLGAEEIIQDTVVTTPQADVNRYVVGNRPDSTSYTAPSGHPTLVSSTVNDPQLAQQALSATVNPTPQFLNATLNNVMNILPSNVDAELTPKEEQAVVTDPQILKLAEKTGVSPQVILKNVQSDKNDAFQELVDKLPPDQAKALTFAQYVPEGAKNLSPGLKAMLQEINVIVNQEVAANFNFSADWPGVETNSTEFRAQLSMNVDAAFTKAVNAKLDEGSISTSDAAMLRAMNNGMATGTPTLKNILQQIQLQVTTQLQSKYGFDVSYQPKGDVTAYNNIVNGDFAQTYQKLVAKYTGTATAEQRALLEKYAANPKDPSIPDSVKQLAKQLADERQLLLQAFPNPDKASMPEGLKAIAKTLIAEGVSAIVAKYGLDSNWNPTINALVSPYIDPAALKTATTAMNIANEVLAHAQAQVNAMPDSPERTLYLEYLKVIGQALITIQEAIYGMQAAQTKVSTALNSAQLESQLNDIAQQQASVDELRKKERKQAKTGKLLNALNWIMKIAMIAFAAATMNPTMIALTLAYVIDSTISEAKGGKSGVQEMFSAVANAMPNNKGGSWATAIVNTFLATFISLSTGNPMIAVNLFTQDSKIMETLVKGCGGKENQQMMAGMIFAVVAQVVLAAGLMLCTGGASTAATLETSVRMVQAIGKVSEATARATVKIATTVVQVTIASMQIAGSGIKLNNSLIQMQMDMLKGRSEAYSEEVQAIIAMLKKIVEKLLALIEGHGDMLVSINTFQGKKWNDASEMSSMIFG